MAQTPEDRVFYLATQLGEAIDQFMAFAKKKLPADRYRVLEGTSRKLLATYERLGTHLGLLVSQYERLATPPRGPRGPATIHQLYPGRRPRT